MGADRSHNRDFSDTSIEAVREIVGHPELTTYLKGFFPDTITGEVRERQFAPGASSTATCFEPPREAALAFFYPRMTTGGMLLLRDFSSGSPWARRDARHR